MPWIHLLRSAVMSASCEGNLFLWVCSVINSWSTRGRWQCGRTQYWGNILTWRAQWNVRQIHRIYFTYPSGKVCLNSNLEDDWMNPLAESSYWFRITQRCPVMTHDQPLCLTKPFLKPVRRREKPFVCFFGHFKWEDVQIGYNYHNCCIHTGVAAIV